MAVQEGIFTRFEGDDVVQGQINIVSAGMWSGGVGTLSAFHTSSVQVGSTGAHYYDVYNGAVGANATASVQFSVTFGHIDGSGSLSGDNDPAASKAVYRQLRNLLLPQGQDRFKFGAAGAETEAAAIHAISLNRTRLKEKMDPGNWELQLSGSSAGTVLHLIDDSGATNDPSVKSTIREFNIISGSITSGTAVTGSSTVYYGKFYPENGILVINPDLLNTYITVAGYATASNTNNNNPQHFLSTIQSGSHFAARREEAIKSTHYFCRVKHGMYNHSQNPTYFTASDGSLTVPSFRTDPKAYITTVGLYNNENELLAVAKLSRPILKSSSREALIKVRLDY